MKVSVSLTVLLVVAIGCHQVCAKSLDWGPSNSKMYAELMDIAMQKHAKAAQMCPLNKPTFVCDTLQHIVNPKLHYYVHICPSSLTDSGLCYQSQLPLCPCDEETIVDGCVTRNITVSGSSVQVEVHKSQSALGHCIKFIPDGFKIGLCCSPTDNGRTPCTPNPPTSGPPTCESKRDIYFILDATHSNDEQAFCRLVYIIQAIRAAIEVTDSSEAQVATVLYESENAFNTGNNYNAMFAFNLEDSCEAVVREKLVQLIYEFKTATKDNLQTLKYPNVRAFSTHPSGAIVLVTKTIIDSNTKRNASVVVLTDGKSQDPVSAINSHISTLHEQAKANPIIAAGIGNGVDRAGLEILTVDTSNAIYEPDIGNAIGLGVKIVEDMRDKGALCEKEANEIIKQLQRNSGQELTQYCNAIFSREPNLPALPQCTASRKSSTFKDMIVAAIEEVLDNWAPQF